MGISNINKKNVDLENTVIKIRNNQGEEQSVSLSVFVQGMAIAADTQAALTIFDSNDDGRIDSDEANELKEKIFEAAGNDKVLDDKELKKMLTNDKNKTFIDIVVEHFKTLVERQVKGQLETTQTTKDGRTIVSNFNRDGSGETKTTESNGTVTTCTYAAGKVLTKKEVVDSDGRKTVSEYEYNEENKPAKVTTSSYNKIGRLKETTTVQNKYNSETGKLESSETKIKAAGKKERTLNTTYTYDFTGKLSDELTEEYTGITMKLPNGKTINSKKTQQVHYDYDRNGKIEKKTTKKMPENITVTADFKDGKIQKQTTEENKLVFRKEGNNLQPTMQKSSSVMEYEYHENGNKKKVTIHGEDCYGKASDTIYEYDENGKNISANKSYFRRGVYVEEKYFGANLPNRIAGGVASEIIEYEDAEKTKIKRRTVNLINEEGILVGDIIYGEDGNRIGEHDFSQLDGKFDTAYQKGRGDCYLLAAINSLSSSELGTNLLKDTISQEGENFVIKFPGAKIARESLIKSMRAKDPNFDISKINIPDKYTITPCELKNAMLKSGAKYSIGDKDVLLLEIAYEKYREAVAITLDRNNLKPSDYMQGFGLNLDCDDYLSGGTSAEAIFILTGKKSDTYLSNETAPVCYIDSDFQMHIMPQKDDNTTVKAATSPSEVSQNTKKRDELIDKLKKATTDGSIQKYAATVSIRVSSQVVNGKTINDGNHAFTIKSVTDDKVVLANPWNPDTDVVMSMEDFLKAAFRISVSDLEQTNSSSQTPEANGPNPVSPTIQNPTNNTVNEPNYTVPPGKGFTTLIREKLIEQGIKPTSDNIQKAKAQFKAANPGAVKIYNGSNRDNAKKGNEYLLANAKVHIPQFKKDENGNVI